MLTPCTIKGIYDTSIDQSNERVLVLSGVGRLEAEGWNLVSSLSIPIYKSFRNSALSIPLNTRTSNEPSTKVISGEQYPVRITNCVCLWWRSRQ